MTQDLRYPIGDFDRDYEVSPKARAQRIEIISDLPSAISAAVSSLTDEQLDTEYRPGGWTVRQTVNHVADSHANALIRFKLTLTEDTPTIKPYEEQLWAELEDGKNAPIEWSLVMLEMMHKRWVMLLKSMTTDQFERKFMHPETKHLNALRSVTGMYSWHGKHHTAHITGLREREEI